MQIYLYLYLLIGVILVATLYSYHNSVSIMDLINLIVCFKKNIYKLGHKKIFTDFILFSFMILLWPLLVILKIHSSYEDLKYKQKTKEEKFQLKNTDLDQKIDRVDIEKQEMVYDPLCAVPDCPFGHLNGAWLNFCEQLEDGVEFWTFDVIWDSPWGTKERYAGYAAVKTEVMIHFLVRQETLRVTSSN